MWRCTISFFEGNPARLIKRNESESFFYLICPLNHINNEYCLISKQTDNTLYHQHNFSKFLMYVSLYRIKKSPKVWNSIISCSLPIPSPTDLSFLYSCLLKTEQLLYRIGGITDVDGLQKISENCLSPQITPTIEDPEVFKDIERQVREALRPAGQ